MKKLFRILLVVGVLFFYGCQCGNPMYKYEIRDSEGYYYYTNAFSNQNGCLKFVDESSGSKDVIIISNKFTIIEKKNWKK